MSQALPFASKAERCSDLSLGTDVPTAYGGKRHIQKGSGIMFDFKVADCHIHSRFSFDGKSEIKEHLERAKELGLYAVAVTEHLEINSSPDDAHEKSSADSHAELERLRTLYPEIKLLRGVELGQATQNFHRAEKALTELDTDFVLGSLHNIKDEDDFYYIDFSKRDPDELYRRYFAELLELIQWGKFDSLAHITYPLRYIIGKYRIPMSEEKYAKYYDEVFSLVAEKGLALEVNTAGIHVGGELCPDESLLKRYKRCGGRLVTLGSDAHEAKWLSTGMNEGRTALLNAGFDSYVYYEKHIPIEIGLK